MLLQPGTRLGTYEIVGQIGAGGMGEIYKARDAKLNRLVAVKVLPPALAADPALVARFEREAKAVAALSHPNVLGIFDFGTEDGHTYAVMELLEGESLRERLGAGPLAPARAIEIATEIAQGLGAAHGQGIIHRDVKPDNIFLTKDGRVKVLDFGLAKQGAAPLPVHSEQETQMGSLKPEVTLAGVILGTVGYMSPEQLRGDPVDHRADIFAFGVVLFELLSGLRPFKGATPMHTMTAIMEEDPPPLVTPKGHLPPAVERLVAHCLEKQPDARFQSMKDVAFALQNLGTATSGSSGQPPVPRPVRRSSWAGLAGAGGVLLLGLLCWACQWPPFSRPVPPVFTRVTFAPGTVDAARFGLDGRSIYFSQRIQGGQPELFVIAANASEPRPLGVTNASLLGVSDSNELAILRGPRPWYGDQGIGTLAQVNGGGGAVKEIQEKVMEATWDRAGLAIISADEAESQVRLEFPEGRTVLQGRTSNLAIKQPRLSHNGAYLAVVATDYTKAELLVFDRQGRKKTLLTKADDWSGDTLTGLAWGPDDQLWCSELQGDQTAVWSISGSGRQQIRWRGPGTSQLMDVSREGRMLLVQQQLRRSVLLQKAGEPQVKDASVLNGTQAMGLSDDGQTLLLLESPINDGGTAQDLAYLRTLDGSPAVRLAKGTPRTLSPDGKWLHLGTDSMSADDLDPAILAAFQRAGLDPRVALDPRTRQGHLLLVPTGAGRPVVVPLPARFEGMDYCQFAPDGHTLLFAANEKGHPYHWYLVDRAGGEPRKVGPDGYGVVMGGLSPMAPDGARMILYNFKHFYLQSFAGGEPQLIQGINPNEAVVRWTRDGKGVYLRTRGNGLSMTITLLNLATGARKPVLAFTLPDPAGFQFFRSVHMTPDARTFAFTYSRKLSELYVVDGVR